MIFKKRQRLLKWSSLILFLFLLIVIPQQVANAEFAVIDKSIFDQPLNSSLELTSLLDIANYSAVCNNVDRIRDNNFSIDGTSTEVVYDIWTGCSGNSPTYLVMVSGSVDRETGMEFAMLFRVPVDEEVDRSFIAKLLSGGGDPIPESMPTLVPVSPTVQPAPRAIIRPKAEVATATLNVRSGPGTDYAIVTKVSQGTQLTILSKLDASCSWLQIQTGGVTGWVSGGLVKADGCPPPPPQVPQACVPFENHFQAEADVTMEGEGDNRTFKVPPRKVLHTECVQPGNYTWTIAIPGWGSINGSGYLEPGRHPVVPIYRKF